MTFTRVKAWFDRVGLDRLTRARWEEMQGDHEMKKVLVVFLTISALAAGAVYAYRQGFLDRWASRTVTSPQPTPGAPVADGPSGAPVPVLEPSPPGAIGILATVPPADTSVDSGPLTNIAASTFGGHIARMTGEFGPGYFGRRLIDGSAASTWKLEPPVKFPQEIVFSFYEREPALVSSIIVSVPAAGSSTPADIEVWTSNESATAGFVKRGWPSSNCSTVSPLASFSKISSTVIRVPATTGFPIMILGSDTIKGSLIIASFH